MKYITIIFVAICTLAFTSSRLNDFGIEEAMPIGPYLNGQLSGSITTWNVEPAFENLTFENPIWMRQIPGRDLFLLTLKKGQIYLIDKENDQAEKKLLLDIEEYVNSTQDAGMFDIAFHPEFGDPDSENRRFIYVAYNYVPERLDSDPIRYLYSYNRVSRFTLSEDLNSIDENSEYVVLQHFDRHVWHSGGALFFDKYGFLNISMGDEGGTNDEFENSQKIDKRLFSGILRIDVDRDSTRSHPIRRSPQDPIDVPDGWPEDIYDYYIPNDNPWASDSEDFLEEFYIIGLRSPHSVFYDEVKDEIWVADVGQAFREEVSVFSKGENGQWAYMEGTWGAGPKPESIYGIPRYPIYDYGREQGAAVIGGFIYNGPMFPQLQGKYIFGDYVSQNVWALNPVNKEVEFLLNTQSEGNVGFASITTDVDGNIYFTQLFSSELNSGSILKLSRQVDQISGPPQYLSELNVFKNLETLEVEEGFIPYELNTELYSDGAIKKRWIAIPNDGSHNNKEEQIVFHEFEEWEYPPGTVLIKHFELPADDTDPAETQKVETRFLVVNENQEVYGITYKWNDDGSDAELLTSSDEKDYIIKGTDNNVRTQSWKFPSPSQCLTCHTTNAGGVLGPKTYTLNRDIDYPRSGITDNQIRAWNHIGIFNTQVESLINGFQKSPNLSDEKASNELKVRSYIDVNCSFCHRPNGVEVDFDARFTTHLSNQKIIEASVVSRNSMEDAFIIAPKDTLHSEMFRRVKEEGVVKMPPLGRDIIDKAFVKVLRDWILELDTLEIRPTEIEFYPNPLQGTRLNICLPEKFISGEETTIRIFSFNGGLVFERRKSFSEHIDLDLDLESGVYIVNISGNGNSRSFKILKNN